LARREERLLVVLAEVRCGGIGCSQGYTDDTAETVAQLASTVYELVITDVDTPRAGEVVFQVSLISTATRKMGNEVILAHLRTSLSETF
jgi:hypothetical protein